MIYRPDQNKSNISTKFDCEHSQDYYQAVKLHTFIAKTTFLPFESFC
jgi:hypothetical protein